MSDSEEPGETDLVRERFDWSTVSPSTAVVETVASVAGRDPDEIEPLYESIDPEAMNALLARTTETSVLVTLTLDAYEIVVRSKGDVVVSATRD